MASPAKKPAVPVTTPAAEKGYESDDGVEDVSRKDPTSPKPKSPLFKGLINPEIQYPAESNRYHLFISRACPFCQRLAIEIVVKGLEKCISVDVVHPEHAGHGFWHHTEQEACSDCTVDLQASDIGGAKTKSLKIDDTHLRVLLEDVMNEGKFSLPLLYDKKTKTIVSVEPEFIFNKLNKEFNTFATNPTLDLVPPKKEKKLAYIKLHHLTRISRLINSAGHAQTKEAFAAAAFDLHNELAVFERTLAAGRRFLSGSHITEVDIILFVTLFPYDPLLSYIFTLNEERITLKEKYPCLWTWLCSLYRMPGVAQALDLVALPKGSRFQEFFGVRLTELGINLPDQWAKAYLHDLATSPLAEVAQSIRSPSLSSTASSSSEPAIGQKRKLSPAGASPKKSPARASPAAQPTSPSGSHTPKRPRPETPGSTRSLDRAAQRIGAIPVVMPHLGLPSPRVGPAPASASPKQLSLSASAKPVNSPRLASLVKNINGVPAPVSLSPKKSPAKTAGPKAPIIPSPQRAHPSPKASGQSSPASPQPVIPVAQPAVNITAQSTAFEKLLSPKKDKSASVTPSGVFAATSSRHSPRKDASPKKASPKKASPKKTK